MFHSERGEIENVDYQNWQTESASASASASAPPPPPTTTMNDRLQAYLAEFDADADERRFRSEKIEPMEQRISKLADTISICNGAYDEIRDVNAKLNISEPVPTGMDRQSIIASIRSKTSLLRDRELSHQKEILQLTQLVEIKRALLESYQSRSVVRSTGEEQTKLASTTTTTQNKKIENRKECAASSASASVASPETSMADIGETSFDAAEVPAVIVPDTPSPPAPPSNGQKSKLIGKNQKVPKTATTSAAAAATTTAATATTAAATTTTAKPKQSRAPRGKKKKEEIASAPELSSQPSSPKPGPSRAPRGRKKNEKIASAPELSSQPSSPKPGPSRAPRGRKKNEKIASAPELSSQPSSSPKPGPSRAPRTKKKNEKNASEPESPPKPGPSRAPRGRKRNQKIVSAPEPLPQASSSPPQPGPSRTKSKKRNQKASSPVVTETVDQIGSTAANASTGPTSTIDTYVATELRNRLGFERKTQTEIPFLPIKPRNRARGKKNAAQKAISAKEVQQEEAKEEEAQQLPAETPPISMRLRSASRRRQ